MTEKGRKARYSGLLIGRNLVVYKVRRRYTDIVNERTLDDMKNDRERRK